MAFHDQYAGDAISCSMTGSRGVFTLPGLVKVDYERKSQSDLTIENQPDKWGTEFEMNVTFVETGRDVIDELDNREGAKQDYYILGQPSRIFKSASFDYKESGEHVFRGDPHEIMLHTSTDIVADVTSSIRNLLTLTGDPSCDTYGSDPGLTDGLSRSGALFGSSSLVTASNSLLTESEGFVQNFAGVGGGKTHVWSVIFPCKSDYDLPFAFSFYVIDSGSDDGSLELETFIRLVDIGSNVLGSDTHSLSLPSGSQIRHEHRSLFRGVSGQVITLQAGFTTVASMSADMDKFQFEPIRVTDWVNR